MRASRALVLIHLIGFSCALLYAEEFACSPWHWVDPTPESVDIGAVLFTGEEFMAWSSDFWQPMMSSSDGQHWVTHRTAIPSMDAVVRANGEYVGVSGGAANMYTSLDGHDWELQFDGWEEAGIYGTCGDIAWNGRLLVAVGSEDKDGNPDWPRPFIYFSTDGRQWQRADLSSVVEEGSLRAVSWVGDRFVAVGRQTMLISANGRDWQAVTSLGGDSVTSSNELIVVAGRHGVLVSADGVSWEEIAMPWFTGGVAWLNGHFVARAYDSTEGIRALVTSLDGRSWEFLDVALDYADIGFGNGRYVAVGENIWWSADLRSWQQWNQRVTPTGGRPIAASGNGRTLLVYGNGAVATSDDGISWALAPPISTSESAVMRDVVWAGERFVAVDSGGTAWLSPDGLGWQAVPTGSSGALREISAHGDRVVAISLSEIVSSSDGGASWSVTDRSDYLEHGSCSTVAVGSNSVVVASDGDFLLVQQGEEDWQVVTLPKLDPGQLIWGGGVFILKDEVHSGSRDRDWISEDGLEWFVTESPNDRITPIVWIDDRFVTWSYDGFFASLDGREWQVVSGPVMPEFDSVFWGAGVLFAADRDGVRRSACGAATVGQHIVGLADLPGRNSTSWQSSVEIHNPQAVPVTVSYELKAREDFPLDFEVSTTAIIPAGSSLVYGNALEGLFGFEGAATLGVQSWGGPIMASGRSFNTAQAGSFGQLVSMMSEEQALAPGEVARFLQLRHSDDPATGFRSNLLVKNLGLEELELWLELSDQDGQVTAVKSLTVAAREYVQVDAVIPWALGEGMEWATLRVENRSRIVSGLLSVSVVDNRSGDPITVLAGEAAPAGSTLYLPGMAHQMGSDGSQWISELVVHNPGSATARATLRFNAWDGGSSAFGPLVLPAGASVVLHDPVLQLFGRSGAGTMLLTVESGELMISGRTFHDSEDGSYGQFVPAMSPDGAAGWGGQLRLLQLAEVEGRNRSNLGLLNCATQRAEITIELFASDGSPLGTLRRGLAAGASLQISSVLGKVSRRDIPEAYAVVAGDTSDSCILAYVSRIDSRTNDPVMVLPARVP